VPVTSQIISINFGALHRRAAFDYSIDIENLSGPLKEFKSELATFTPQELQFLRWRMVWKGTARKKQLPPKEFEDLAKDIWLIISGRGFGKTLALSNWIGVKAAEYPSMYAIIAPTKDDVRYTNFEGPTGLYAVLPPQLIVDKNLALPSITLWQGSIIRGFAGDTPERLRGPQHAAVGCDEIASWQYPEDSWANMMFGLRLGPHPQVAVVGTPKPSAFIRDMAKRKDVVYVRGSTYENRENLTESYFANVAKYEGTKIGRQEIHGEILDPEESGFVKRSQWQMWPRDRPLPRFQYIVVSLDTAFTEATHDRKKQENDPTACTVWGLFSHGSPTAQKCIMLLDAWEDYLGFPQLIKRVKQERRRRFGAIVEGPVLLRPKINNVKTPEPQGKKVDLLLIEEKSSGTSLIQQLAVEDILAQPYNPGSLDKLSRLHVVSLLWAHRRVWAVESDSMPGQFRMWAEPVITQVCTYTGEGSLKHDDLLDTTTQAARYFLDHHIGSLTIPRDEEEERRKAAVEARRKLEQKRRVNPYDG